MLQEWQPAELHGRIEDKVKGTGLFGWSSRNLKISSFKNRTRKGELFAALWKILHSCTLNCHSNLHNSATRNIAPCIASADRILHLSATVVMV